MYKITANSSPTTLHRQFLYFCPDTKGCIVWRLHFCTSFLWYRHFKTIFSCIFPFKAPERKKERANQHDLSSVFSVAFYSHFFLRLISSLNWVQLTSVSSSKLGVCVHTSPAHPFWSAIWSCSSSSIISQLTCQVFSAFSLVYLTTTTTTASKILAPPRLKEKNAGGQ